MDVQVEREQRVHLRDSEDERAAQVPPSDEAKLLHVDRCRSCRDAGRIAAEPRQRRVSGEFSLSRCCLSVLCVLRGRRTTTVPFCVYNFQARTESCVVFIFVRSDTATFTFLFTFLFTFAFNAFCALLYALEEEESSIDDHRRWIARERG